MIFTVNTKPLQSALNLGVISSNVSPFHRKSTIIELTADKSTLRLNVESAQIKSEMNLKGSGDEDGPAKLFIGSLIFKQLMSTIDTDTVGLEFAAGGLKIHSGKSILTLPKLVDDDDIELDRPMFDSNSTVQQDINKDEWKFIKDRQMFAISLSFIHPVYAYVWMSERGNVLVGDFDNSLFTHSIKGNLESTCLLSDTIVNLFDSIPDGATLSKVSDREFSIQYTCDSFTYVTQFSPKYEDDPSIGSYNSDIFLDMMQHPEEGTKVNVPIITKYLNQASMLSTTADDVIQVAVNDDIFVLKDKNVNCELQIDNNMPVTDFNVKFKLENLKKVIGNYNTETVNIYPVMQEAEVAGLLIWDDDLTTIIAGVDE